MNLESNIIFKGWSSDEISALREKTFGEPVLDGQEVRTCVAIIERIT